MIWVGWRQQRVEVAIAAAMLAVIAAVAIPVGVHMESVYTHEGLRLCAGNLSPASPCNVTVASFLTRFSGMNVLFIWSSVLSALTALLFAAPFVLDLDSGTYRLFWTQSITRRRWTVTKLGLSAVGALVIAGCLTALATWSRAPLDHLNGRMSTNVYDIEGIVPVAYALFVLGVAAALGAIWRRTVPSLLVAFLVYIVGRAFMDSWLRQRLITPVKTIWRAGKPGPNLNSALVIDQFVSDKSGKKIASLGGSCVRSSHGGLLSHTTSVCSRPVPRGAHVYMTAIYQPASSFWHLQGIEFAIVAGLGALLVLLAGWWTYRRIA